MVGSTVIVETSTCRIIECNVVCCAKAGDPSVGVVHKPYRKTGMRTLLNAKLRGTLGLCQRTFLSALFSCFTQVLVKLILRLSRKALISSKPVLEGGELDFRVFFVFGNL